MSFLKYSRRSSEGLIAPYSRKEQVRSNYQRFYPNNDKTFKKLCPGNRAEKKLSNSVCYLKSEKDKLRSFFTSSPSFCFGYEEDRKMVDTLDKFYKKKTPSRIENLNEEKVEAYYNSCVDHAQTKLGDSCYDKSRFVPKRELSYCLQNQIKQKKEKIKSQRALDKQNFNDYYKGISKEHQRDRREKLLYQSDLRKEFVNSNSFIQKVREREKGLLRDQTLRDEIQQEALLQNIEHKFEQKQKIKMHRAKEYLKRELLSQINSNKKKKNLCN